MRRRYRKADRDAQSKIAAELEMNRDLRPAGMGTCIGNCLVPDAINLMSRKGLHLFARLLYRDDYVGRRINLTFFASP